MVDQFGFLSLDTLELLLVLLIVLLLLGSRKLPELVKLVRPSTRQLSKSLDEGGNDKNQKQAGKKSRKDTGA